MTTAQHFAELRRQMDLVRRALQPYTYPEEMDLDLVIAALEAYVSDLENNSNEDSWWKKKHKEDCGSLAEMFHARTCLLAATEDRVRFLEARLLACAKTDAILRSLVAVLEQGGYTQERYVEVLRDLKGDAGEPWTALAYAWAVLGKMCPSPDASGSPSAK